MLLISSVNNGYLDHFYYFGGAKIRKPVNKRYLVPLCLLGLLLLTSCQTHSVLSSPLVKGSTYPAVSPEKVAVYATPKAPKSYEIIAELVAMCDAGQDAEVPIRILREEAAKIGADAIVNLRLNFGMGFWITGLKATATAVKYND